MGAAAKFLTTCVLGAAGTLLYGGLVESRKLQGTRRRLRLVDWPKHLDGFTIGLLTDTHLSHYHHVELAQKGCQWLVDQNPDVILHLGDIQNYHKPEADDWIREALAPIQTWGGEAIAILGNHDFFGGEPDRLKPLMAECGFRLLRNERYVSQGIQWIGVDSAAVGRSDPFTPLLQTDGESPIVVLWHEPDMADWLPKGPDLMLSGHSHGGQFVMPWGWPPMTSRLGSKYISGFYPHLPTPLFVSRGVGITGPPARLFCPAEVDLLVIESAV